MDPACKFRLRGHHDPPGLPDLEPKKVLSQELRDRFRRQEK
jgi:hypothetical protein